MDEREKNDIFIDNSNLEGRMSVFHDKLKRHLSNEYLFLSEKKNNLENEIFQLKLEKNRRDKKLFSNVEKKDVRKYFSPLNLSEIDEEQKGEREKQLTESINRINGEVEILDNRLMEIKYFLQDIEKMLSGGEGIFSILSEKEKNTDAHQESFFQEYEIEKNFYKNFRNMEEYLKNKHGNFEMLLEVEKKDVSFDQNLMKNILKQILSNISAAIEDCGVSIVLIEEKVEKNKINLVLNYTCEDKKIDSMKVIYEVELD